MSNLSEEEKKAIEITKTIIEFAGDSYIPKENRKALQTLLNLIDKYEKEIDTYKETENDYEHELARKDEEIENLKKHYEMATRIIEGYADEVEKDTLKIENYRHKNIK